MTPLFMLCFTVASIYLVFLVIKPINFNKLMPYTPWQAAMLKVIVATVLGYLLATCLISLTTWIFDLPASLLKH
ncbi:DUF1146 domain-containing protein [Leuconostocaceae bacterium ESL0723]|nr:DUF1146 domain-containing protein [Lactobacillaceae bacterium L1_55_11]WEV54745.1 DUF1146 domain-containing protein [Leuconostocaceae bacterium ESL0723]